MGWFKEMLWEILLFQLENVTIRFVCDDKHKQTDMFPVIRF